MGSAIISSIHNLFFASFPKASFCGDVLTTIAVSAPSPVPPTAISLQRVAKARLVVLLSDIPIHLYINSASNDPIAGTFFIQVADTTTGITSLYIKNDIATSGDATVEFFIGGDEATT